VKTRKIKDGMEVQELDKPVQLSILTKCPAKWKIVDMETGQEYIASCNYEMYKQWKEVKK